MFSEFESLRGRLLREGVAPRHVRRYLTELREHLADFAARERAAGHDAKDAAIRARAALGDDEILSRAMLARPGSRSLSARAPWAVFGLLPPLAAVAAIVIAVALMFGLDLLVITAETHEHLFGHLISKPNFWFASVPAWFQALAAFVTAACNYGFGILVAIPFVIIALRQRMGLAWPLAGIILIAIFASLVTVWMDFPSLAALPHLGAPYVTFATGISFPLDKSHPFVLQLFLLRTLVTLLPVTALYLALRQRLRVSAPSV